MQFESLKRSEYFSIYLEDEERFDVQAFFAGRVERAIETEIKARSWLTGRIVALGQIELAVLSRVPAGSWVAPRSVFGQSPNSAKEDLQRATLHLIEAGLILAKSDDPRAVKILKANQRVKSNFWPSAVLAQYRANYFHESAIGDECRKPDYERRLETASSDADAFVMRRGVPPSARFSINATKRVKLPRNELDGEFFNILKARRTTRLFDANATVPFEKASSLLRYVFGAWGVYQIGSHHEILHKTSASGGGLHPTEAFPIVSGVEGVDSGIYHYNCCLHQLDLIKRLGQEEARALCRHFSQDQSYAGEVQLAVLLAVRWARNFWKYQERPNTYNVIMMDAGHLSQSFYLTATALGLGAFYTAALNHRSILKELELDELEFGSIGLCGCGVLKDSVSELPYREI